MQDGYFLPWFNVLYSKDSPINKGTSMPEDFTPFVIEENDIEELRDYAPVQLTSKSVKSENIATDATGYLLFFKLVFVFDLLPAVKRYSMGVEEDTLSNATRIRTRALFSS